ncbi:MAG TPA: serine/threonine-protein kinase, partial [Polyangium sp.]|nr:serine/threonine-protein kinase [Polyangium sp.]
MATCPTCMTQYPDDVTTCSADGSTLVGDHVLPSKDLSLKPGTTVGEYRIERKIGEGGFGAVYSAVHPVIGKSAAIKILSPQFSADPVMVSRFISEARAVNQIRHRGIIDIFAFGKLDDGRQYYIMELLEGKTLEEYLRERGRLRPAEALPILRQVARALDAAHAAGIAHRDLKPENIFLVFDEDGTIMPKLLDFGIAKLLGDSQQSKTRTGTPMGTPLYMSPEQCRGKQVDHRTDIYSFGIMTHVMITGQPVFSGEDIMDVMMAQVGSTPPSASSVCPDIPHALDAPILRMLAKEADARPQTLGAAVDELVAAARTAGIDVPSVAVRSSEKLPAMGLPANKSSEEVFAPTLVQPGVTIDP